jgi:hypothetical protein
VSGVQLELPIASLWCQRSTASGRQTWRHADESFHPDRYGVVRISHSAAKPWIIDRHYSGSYPADRLRYGLFDLAGRGPALVGVAVLSVPVSTATLTRAFPSLEPFSQTLELGRFCLDDSVPGNGESYFIGQMRRLAAEDGIRGLVSFADPLQRRAADGTVICPGHRGVIYQASGFCYSGRSAPRSLLLLPDGTVLPPRVIAKVRALERGHLYAEQRLAALGARPRIAGESGPDWLAEALRTIGARAVRHPGNHRYLIRLGRTRSERTAVTIGLASRPYPKTIARSEPAPAQ